MSDFALKRLSICSLTQKVFSNIVKDLFKSIERLRRSGKIQVGSKAEKIIVLGGLRRKYLTLGQISAQKTIYMQFNKKCYPI